MIKEYDFQHLGGVLASIPLRWGLDDSILRYRGVRFDWEWTRNEDILVLSFDAPSKADFESFTSNFRNDLKDMMELGLLNEAPPNIHDHVEPKLFLGDLAKHSVSNPDELGHTVLRFGHSPKQRKSTSNHLFLFHPIGWDGIGHYVHGDRRMGAVEIQVKGYTRLAAQVQSKARIGASWQALNNSLPIRLRVVGSKLLLTIGVLGLFASVQGMLFIMFGSNWPTHSLQPTLWIALIGIGGSYLLGMRTGREHRLTQLNLDVFEDRRRWVRSVFDLPNRLSNIRIHSEEIVRR